MSSNIPTIFKWYLNRQGIQGQQGVQGEEGFSPTITVYEDTLTKYTLKVQDKSGYFITPNLRQVTQDSGGTYVRYDRSTGQLFAGFADGATDTQVGVVRLATPQEVIDGAEDAVITPANLIDYLTDTYQLPIATTAKAGAVKPDGTTITIDPDGTIHGASTYVLPIASTTTLGGIKVGDGLSITDDGVLSASGGGSELNHIQDTKLGVQIDNGDPIPQAGTYYHKNIELRSVSSTTSSDLSAQINANVNTYQDGTLEQTNSETIVVVGAGEFWIGNYDTQLRLYSSDEIQAEVGLGVTKVVTTGLRYKTLTSAEYEALSTKDPDTMYRLTDTNEVYLGTIPLTGGANAQYKTSLINNYDNATQTNLGGSTTVQVTDTEV